MKGLTKRQREIVDFVDQFIRANKYSPSYKEIMTQFGFTSLGSVYSHIRTLKRKGALAQEEKCGRSLTLASTHEIPLDPTGVQVSLIGHLAAGSPIEMFPHVQMMMLPRLFVPRPDTTYILRARGNSLAAESIVDGDLVVVEVVEEVEPGSLVIALIGGKTYVKRHNPEEPSLAIQGIVTGVLRLYQ